MMRRDLVWPWARWLYGRLQRLRNRWTRSPARANMATARPLTLNTQHICSGSQRQHIHNSFSFISPNQGNKSTVHAGKNPRLGCNMKPQNMLVFSAVVSDMKTAALNLFSPDPNQSGPTWALLWLFSMCLACGDSRSSAWKVKGLLCFIFHTAGIFLPLKITIYSHFFLLLENDH